MADGLGEQLDLRPVRVPATGAIGDGMVAGDLASYATKSTDATGHAFRLTNETIGLHADRAC